MEAFLFLLVPLALIYLGFQFLPGATWLILAILEVTSAYPLFGLALPAVLNPPHGPGGGGEGFVALFTIGFTILWLILAGVLYRTCPWRRKNRDFK